MRRQAGRTMIAAVIGLLFGAAGQVEAGIILDFSGGTATMTGQGLTETFTLSPLITTITGPLPATIPLDFTDDIPGNISSTTAITGTMDFTVQINGVSQAGQITINDNPIFFSDFGVWITKISSPGSGSIAFPDSNVTFEIGSFGGGGSPGATGTGSVDATITALTPSSVPEPSTAVMAALGTVAFLAYRMHLSRRRI